jgi:PadR family transcriptional regulator AphA
MLKYTLLGLLQYRPLTGYDLKQTMDKSTVHFWHAKLSQIYTTLKALEAEGWVKSTVKEQAERPDRRVYSITPAGRRALQQWLAEPDMELSPKKETLILKVFFAGQMERETLLTQLRLHRDLHRRQATSYRDVTSQEIDQAVAQYPALARDAKLWHLTRRFGEKYEELYVEWIEETIQLVEREF